MPSCRLRERHRLEALIAIGHVHGKRPSDVGHMDRQTPRVTTLQPTGLIGMAKALEEQRRQSDLTALDFEERLALMVDRETIERENKRLVTRLKFARLRQSAVVEDINMKAPRSLDKGLFQKLVAGDWIERHQNLLIIGQAGVGKSFIACALGHKACRDNRSVLYYRLPRLFDALLLARGDGRYGRLLKSWRASRS